MGENRHRAMWQYSLAVGNVSVSIPMPITEEEVDEIELLFELIVRRARREFIATPTEAAPLPEPPKEAA